MYLCIYVNISEYMRVCELVVAVSKAMQRGLASVSSQTGLFILNHPPPRLSHFDTQREGFKIYNCIFVQSFGDEEDHILP